MVVLVQKSAGTFRIGDIQADGDKHEVSVGRFAMGKYEVTFAEYDQFAEATDRTKPDDNGWGRDNNPEYNGKEKVCFSNMQAKFYSRSGFDFPYQKTVDKRAVVRGCSWHDDSSNCRIANRTFRSKIYDEPSSQVGFRVVMVGGIQ